MDGDKKKLGFKIAAWSGVLMMAAGIGQTFTGYTSPLTYVFIIGGAVAAMYFHLKTGKRQ